MDPSSTHPPKSAPKPTIRRVPGLKLTAAQEALMQRAFVDSAEVLVEQEFHSRYSGAAVYLVSRPEQAPVVVKLAPPYDIQREYTAYRELVEKTAPQHTMRLLGEMITSDDSQLALLTYTFVGGDADHPTTSLGAYYSTRGGSAAAEVLNRIFRVYGKLWWLNNQLDRRVTGEEYDRLLPAHLQLAVVSHVENEPKLLHGGDVDLATLRSLRAGQYVRLRGFEITKAQPGLLHLRAGAPLGERSAPLRLRLEGALSTAYQFGDILEPQLAVITATREMVLAEAIRALIPTFDEHDPTFTFNALAYPNPLRELNRLLDVTYDARVSIIQGDLNLQNILVDDNTGFGWLIDFAETRRGPTLFDLQHLEVQVITRILPTVLARTGLDPKAFVSLLEALNSHYLAPTAPLPALQEPYAFLAAIRRLARQFLVLDQEWEEYYRGLVIGLLAVLKVPDLDAPARMLAVIGAATIYRLINVPLAEPQIVAQPAQAQPPAPGASPFKGLQHFDVADADNFYGREALTAELIAHLRERRFLAIVAASGSGKSSLARAGVIPALQRGQPLSDGSLPPSGSSNWPVYLFTPTESPIKALATALTQGHESVTATARLLDDLGKDARSLDLYIFRILREMTSSAAKDRKLVLVIDQFEELFTLCHNRQERKSFVDNLLTAAAGGQTLIVLTLRADFYAHCAEFENLRRVLENQQKYIGPMNKDELRRAIEEPARRNQWQLEPGLVDLFLGDVGDEPGALPLLSHALLETWNRRQGRTLTLAGYAAAGRVQGAIAQTAEKVYNQQLPPEQRPIARNIFLRLTELGEGAQDTRRRVPLPELIPQNAQAKSVEDVINTLADARLITVFAGAAEVAHEALIREWPRLREWLADDREGLRVHRRLTEAAQEWKALAQDSDALLRGIRLDQALAWAAQHGNDMNDLERTFLDTSREAVEKAVRVREQARRRELEQAQALAKEQQQRAQEQQQRAIEQQKRAEEQALAASRLRRRALYLAGALAVAVLAVISTGLLFRDAREARLQEAVARATAVAGQAEAVRAQEAAEANRQIAETNRQQAEAETQRAEAEKGRADLNAARSEAEKLNAQRQAEIARAGRLAAQAQMVMQNQPARASSLSLLLGQEAVLTTWLADSTIITQPFVTDEADAALRYAVDHAPPWRMTMPLYRHTSDLTDVAFSPDGRLLVTASNDTTAHLWDAITGQHLYQLTGHQDGIAAVAFSPDGQFVATGSGDMTVHLWNVKTGREVRRFIGHTLGINDVIFSSDGQLLLTASNDLTACLWTVATGEQIRCFVGGHSDLIRSAALSPDGILVATSSQDTTVCLWTAATGEQRQCLQGHTEPARTVLFHPDGKRLLTSAWDGTVRIWDLATGQELSKLEYENRFINQIALSPDGQSLLTASRAGGRACLWALEGEEPLRCFEGHLAGVNSVAFSPDGHTIATGSADRTARLWNMDDGAEILAFGGHTDRITQSVFSPDGHTIATVGLDATLRLWNAQNGELLYWVKAHSQPINGVAFSPDGALLATVSDDQTGRLWNAKTGEAIRGLAGHAEPVKGVAFSPDGKLLLTASADKTVRLWNTATGGRFQRLDGHTAAVNAAVFSPDGRQVATASLDQTVRLWDVETAQEIRSFEGHTSEVTALAFSPDGRLLITGGTDKTVRLWNVADGREIYRFDGHGDSIWSLAFSPDGQTFASASEDLTARLWDVAKQQQILMLDGHMAGVNSDDPVDGVTSVSFSPDGQTLLTAGADTSVRQWGVATWDQTHVLRGHTDDVNAGIFSQDGKLLFTTGDDLAIRVWDVATARVIRQMNGHRDTIVTVAFSPDGKLAVTASADHTARLWDPTNGNQLRHLEGHTAALSSAAFSPDGKLIVTASADRTARIWDVKTATEVRRLLGHTDQVNGALFSPDGQTVVTVSRDKRIRLWDTATGDLRQTLEGHTGEVKAGAFSPDGTALVTASSDRTARLWDLTSGKEIYMLQGPTEGVDIVSFSPDGQTILTAGGDQIIHLWDRSTGKEVNTIKREQPFLSITFSPDGSAILITGPEPVVYLVELATGKEIPYETAHDGDIFAAAFSPDGRHVLTAGSDLTSRLWDLIDGSEVHQLSGHTDTVNFMARSPDGRRLVTGSDDKTVRIWDIETGAQVGELPGHLDEVEGVAYSPDGKTIATVCDDRLVRIWDANTGELLHSLKGHESDLNAVAYSPDSKWIVTASHDHTARLWNVATGEPGLVLVGDNKEVDSAAFSPDGKLIATVSRSRLIYLWDAATGEQVNILRGHADIIYRIAFSPDGKLLATASADNSARIWDVATGQPLRILEGHTNVVTSLAFSPDGKELVTTSEDFDARIWPVYIEDLMSAAQALIQRSPIMFNGEERRRYEIE